MSEITLTQEEKNTLMALDIHCFHDTETCWASSSALSSLDDKKLVFTAMTHAIKVSAKGRAVAKDLWHEYAITPINDIDDFSNVLSSWVDSFLGPSIWE